MQQITIVTTYYNNVKLLTEFVDEFKTLRAQYPFFNLIIIDDGSEEYPAEKYIKKENGISLYSILEDVGFNGHGARNLGMEVSQTYWNILIDIDYNITLMDVDEVCNLSLDKDTIYFFNMNTFLINKDIFFSCYGYDEEFYNIHFGDRIFVGYLKSKFNHIELKKDISCKRNGHRVIHTEKFLKTTYKDGILYHPKSVDKRREDMLEIVKKRYASEDFETKFILNFKWKKIF